MRWLDRNKTLSSCFAKGDFLITKGQTMNNQGYISVYRKILDNPISKKPSWAWLWVVILLKVNHTNSEFIFNGSKECVKRGEFITGRKQLSIDTGISESTVENILKYLESEHQIEQQKTSKFRRIKVINYDMYQNNEQHFEQQIDNKLTTNKQQIDTNNNDNKEDNEKNEEEENSTNLFLNKKRSEEIKEIYIQEYIIKKAKENNLDIKDLEVDVIKERLNKEWAKFMAWYLEHKMDIRMERLFKTRFSDWLKKEKTIK